MALETTVILRSILYQAKKAGTVSEVINAIEVMCSKDDVAAVNEQIAKEKENKASE
jgi:hypothetical protein